MSNVSTVAFSVFLFFFLLVTVLGFVAARWRRAADMGSLDEWGLGGRGFGTFIAWFLIGGDLYTAYTFVAVPALLYAGSAIGFFAVPYTIVVYPLIFLFLPRLWSVSHRHGYVTPADFVEGRYDSRPLALAVALTGILATMPYIALQLVGIEVVLEVMGIGTDDANWFVKDLPLFIAFAVLAAYTYSSGLRAPALIAFVKDTLIYIVIIVAVLYLPTQLGGWDHIFSTASDSFAAHNETNADAIAAGEAAPKSDDPRAAAALGVRVAGPRLGAGAVHVPALGDRGALDAEPFGDPAQRRAAAGVLVPARTARAARLRRDRRRRQGDEPAAGRAAAVRERVPRLVRGRGVRGHRDRRTGAGGDHVDRGREPVDPQHLQGLHQPGRHPRPGGAAEPRSPRSWSSSARCCSCCSCPRRTPSTCSCSAASGSCRPSRRSWSASTPGGSTDGRCSPAGRSGMVYGTLVAYGNPKVGDPGSHFGSPLNEFPTTETLVYIGFTALVLNLLVTVVLTVALRAAGVDEGTDATSPEDYGADVGDEGVEPELTSGRCHALTAPE